MKERDDAGLIMAAVLLGGPAVGFNVKGTEQRPEKSGWNTGTRKARYRKFSCAWHRVGNAGTTIISTPAA